MKIYGRLSSLSAILTSDDLPVLLRPKTRIILEFNDFSCLTYFSLSQKSFLDSFGDGSKYTSVPRSGFYPQKYLNLPRHVSNSITLVAFIEIYGIAKDRA